MITVILTPFVLVGMLCYGIGVRRGMANFGEAWRRGVIAGYTLTRDGGGMYEENAKDVLLRAGYGEVGNEAGFQDARRAFRERLSNLNPPRMRSLVGSHVFSEIFEQRNTAQSER